MADAVSTRVLNNNGKYYTAVFTNISDGTGEAAVVKVDKSALVNALGQEPGALSILRVDWSVQGFTRVAVAFDHTTDDTVLLLAGTGTLCLKEWGGLKDPKSAGGTGDIVFTAPAGANTGTYTILLHCGK